jgi:hypothetical protein
LVEEKGLRVKEEAGIPYASTIVNAIEVARKE